MGAFSVIRVGFPIFLLIAALCRFTLFSLGYLFLFFAYCYLRPLDKRLGLREWKINDLYWYTVSLYTVAVSLTQIIFQIVYAANDDIVISDGMRLFGLIRLFNFGKGLQMLGVDIIMAILSTFTFYTIRRNRRTKNSGIHRLHRPSVLKLMGWALSLLLLLSGIGYPSFITLPYFLAFAGMFILVLIRSHLLSSLNIHLLAERAPAPGSWTHFWDLEDMETDEAAHNTDQLAEGAVPLRQQEFDAVLNIAAPRMRLDAASPASPRAGHARNLSMDTRDLSDVVTRQRQSVWRHGGDRVPPPAPAPPSPGVDTALPASASAASVADDVLVHVPSGRHRRAMSTHVSAEQRAVLESDIQAALDLPLYRPADAATAAAVRLASLYCVLHLTLLHLAHLPVDRVYQAVPAVLGLFSVFELGFSLAAFIATLSALAVTLVFVVLTEYLVFYRDINVVRRLFSEGTAANLPRISALFHFSVNSHAAPGATHTATNSLNIASNQWLSQPAPAAPASASASADGGSTPARPSARAAPYHTLPAGATPGRRSRGNSSVHGHAPGMAVERSRFASAQAHGPQSIFQPRSRGAGRGVRDYALEAWDVVRVEVLVASLQFARSLCHVALLISSLLCPSVLSFGFMLAFVVSCCLSDKHLKACTPIVVLYSLVCTLLQFLFAIPSMVAQTDPALVPMGLERLHPSFFRMLNTLAPALVWGLGFMWCILSADDVEALRIRGRRRVENLKHSKALRLIQFTKALLLYVCDKITLVILFLLALYTVNIFHAIFLVFFIVFLSARRVAKLLWPLLVVYTGAVLCAIYGFGVIEPWANPTHASVLSADPAHAHTPQPALALAAASLDAPADRPDDVLLAFTASARAWTAAFHAQLQPLQPWLAAPAAAASSLEQQRARQLAPTPFPFPGDGDGDSLADPFAALSSRASATNTTDILETIGFFVPDSRADWWQSLLLYYICFAVAAFQWLVFRNNVIARMGDLIARASPAWLVIRDNTMLVVAYLGVLACALPYPASVFKLGTAVIVVASLLSHIVFKQPRPALQKIWVVAVGYFAVVFIVEYLYQFRFIREWIHTVYPLDRFTPADMGFELARDVSFGVISSISGPVFSFVLAVLYLRVLLADDHVTAEQVQHYYDVMAQNKLLPGSEDLADHVREDDEWHTRNALIGEMLHDIRHRKGSVVALARQQQQQHGADGPPDSFAAREEAAVQQVLASGRQLEDAPVSVDDVDVRVGGGPLAPPPAPPSPDSESEHPPPPPSHTPLSPPPPPPSAPPSASPYPALPAAASINDSDAPYAPLTTPSASPTSSLAPDTPAHAYNAGAALPYPSMMGVTIDSASAPSRPPAPPAPSPLSDTNLTPLIAADAASASNTLSPSAAAPAVSLSASVRARPQHATMPAPRRPSQPHPQPSAPGNAASIEPLRVEHSVGVVSPQGEYLHGASALNAIFHAEEDLPDKRGPAFWLLVLLPKSILDGSGRLGVLVHKHIYKIVFIFAWFLATEIQTPNLINLLLVFWLLLFLFLGKGRHGWGVLAVYSTCMFVVRYVYQIGQFDRSLHAEALQYIGLEYWGAGALAIRHIWAEALLIALCCLQRVSYVNWRPVVLTPEELLDRKRKLRADRVRREEARLYRLERELVRQKLEREQDKLAMETLKNINASSHVRGDIVDNAVARRMSEVRRSRRRSSAQPAASPDTTMPDMVAARLAAGDDDDDLVVHVKGGDDPNPAHDVPIPRAPSPEEPDEETEADAKAARLPWVEVFFRVLWDLVKRLVLFLFSAFPYLGMQITFFLLLSTAIYRANVMSIFDVVVFIGTYVFLGKRRISKLWSLLIVVFSLRILFQYFLVIGPAPWWTYPWADMDPIRQCWLLLGNYSVADLHLEFFTVFMACFQRKYWVLEQRRGAFMKPGTTEIDVIEQHKSRKRLRAKHAVPEDNHTPTSHLPLSSSRLGLPSSPSRGTLASPLLGGDGDPASPRAEEPEYEYYDVWPVQASMLIVAGDAVKQIHPVFHEDHAAAARARLAEDDDQDQDSPRAPLLATPLPAGSPRESLDARDIAPNQPFTVGAFRDLCRDQGVPTPMSTRDPAPGDAEEAMPESSSIAAVDAVLRRKRERLRQKFAGMGAHPPVWDEEHEVGNTVNSVWPIVRFIFMLLIDKLIFITVFVISTWHSDVVRIGYFILAMYILFNKDMYIGHIAGAIRCWNYLQRFNVLMLALMMCYQTPFLDDFLDTHFRTASDEVSWSKVIGIARFNTNDAESRVTGYSAQGALHAIIIFLLIEVQRAIFNSEAYLDVVRFWMRVYAQSVLKGRVSAQMRQDKRNREITKARGNSKAIDDEFERILASVDQIEDVLAGKGSFTDEPKPADDAHAHGGSAPGLSQLSPPSLAQSSVSASGTPLPPYFRAAASHPAQHPADERKDRTPRLSPATISPSPSGSSGHDRDVTYAFFADQVLWADPKPEGWEEQLVQEQAAKQRLAEIQETQLQLLEAELDEFENEMLIRRDEITKIHAELAALTEEDALELASHSQVQRQLMERIAKRQEEEKARKRSRHWKGRLLGLLLKFKRLLLCVIDPTLLHSYGELDGNIVELPSKRLPEEKPLLHLLYLVVASYSQVLVIFVYLLNAMLNPSFLTLVVAAALLLYGMLQSPRASHAFVVFLFVYTAALSCAQFIFQMPVFCVTLLSRQYSLQPDPACGDLTESESEWQRDNLFGIYKVSMGTFMNHIGWQFAALILLVWHRSVLMTKGVWFQSEELLGDDILQKSAEFREREALLELRAFKRKRFMKKQKEEIRKGQDPALIVSDDRDPCVSKYCVLRALPVEVKETYYEVIPRSGKAIHAVKPGTDLYFVTFMLELVASIWIILAYSNMATTTAQNVGSSLNSNFFQGDMVITLFIQIMFVIFDRVTYLKRSLLCKVILQYAGVLFWGWSIFFSWPVGAMRGFVSNPTLQFFFVVKAAFYILSAYQIQAGYPPQDTPNMQALTHDVALPRYLAFRVYRAIPFIFELRVLLDWYCSKTALDLWDAFKLEDIYATLYIAERLIFIRNDKARGKSVPAILKLVHGLLIFVVLVLVLFIPLLMFSSANPVSSTNNVIALEISSQLVTGSGTYSLVGISSIVSMEQASSDVFTYMRKRNMVDSNDFTSSVQVIQPSSFADSFWTISPESLDNLSANLATSTDTISLDVSIEFKRREPAERPTVTTTSRATLSAANIQRLIDVLDPAKPDIHNVTVSNAVPQYLRLPSTADPIILTDRDEFGDIVLELASEGGTRWWSLYQYDAATGAKSNVAITSVSNPVWGTSLFQGFDYSIIAIYTVVIFTIGQFVRLVFGGSTQRIMIEELMDVSRLMRFCQGIYIARAHGLLLREEELYRKLVRIYRSADKLVQLTARVDPPPDDPGRGGSNSNPNGNSNSNAVRA